MQKSKINKYITPLLYGFIPFFSNQTKNKEENYETNKSLYIKVKSVDVFGKTLQTDPNTSPGKYIYEVKPFSPRQQPYSFNKELYNRLQ